MTTCQDITICVGTDHTEEWLYDVCEDISAWAAEFQARVTFQDVSFAVEYTEADSQLSVTSDGTILFALTESEIDTLGKMEGTYNLYLTEPGEEKFKFATGTFKVGL